MNDQDPLRALTVELASSAPLPPPMPRVDDPRRNTTWQGARLAASVALAIVLVTGVTAAVWNRLATSDNAPVASSSVVFEAAGATPVAFVTKDGTTVRAYLWEGNHNGVVIVPAFGMDAAEIIRFATGAHATGATVMLVEPRGQGQSEGRQNTLLLPSDIEDAIFDIQTRGADEVTLVGMRHSATAAIVVATGDVEGLDKVVAIFPFLQYQGLDAIGVIGSAKVPLRIVGTGHPSPVGPWSHELGRKAPEGLADVEVLPFAGEEVSLLDAHMERLIEIIRSSSY